MEKNAGRAQRRTQLWHFYCTRSPLPPSVWSLVCPLACWGVAHWAGRRKRGRRGQRLRRKKGGRAECAAGISERNSFILASATYSTDWLKSRGAGGVRPEPLRLLLARICCGEVATVTSNRILQGRRWHACAMSAWVRVRFMTPGDTCHLDSERNSSVCSHKCPTIRKRDNWLLKKTTWIGIFSGKSLCFSGQSIIPEWMCGGSGWADTHSRPLRLCSDQK